jgi:hypothetical protein
VNADRGAPPDNRFAVTIYGIAASSGFDLRQAFLIVVTISSQTFITATSRSVFQREHV